MAETEQSSPPQSPNVQRFRVWPPTDRTRDHVRDRLIETLSTPCLFTKIYGTISREEATDAVKLIEEEAFQSAGKTASTDDKGFDNLEGYSKEISRRMLYTIKARSGETAVPVNDSAEEVKVEVEAPSTAPPLY